MKPRRRAIAGIVVVVVALGATACGGSSSTSSTQPARTNGEAAKSPDQILADAKAAATSAHSVHLEGQVPGSSTPISVDLHLSAAHKTTGDLDFDGGQADFVRVGSTVYVRGPLSFYAAIGAPPAAIASLAGRWIQAPVDSAALASFRSFLALTDFEQLVAKTLTPTALPLVKSGTGTQNGTPVVFLTDAAHDRLAVSLVGTPYPVAVIPPPTQQGQLTFRDWNVPVTVTVPAGAISLAALGG